MDTTLKLPRRRRRIIRIPVYTVQAQPHPQLGHTLTWPPLLHGVDPDQTITLTESGRQLALEIIARRDQEGAQ